MELFYYFAMLFLLSMVPFIEALFSVPVAVLTGMPLIPVIIVASGGNFLSLLITIWIVYGVKNTVKKRKEQNEAEDAEKEKFMSRRKERAKRLWEKYGMPGLAVLGYLLLGGHIAASLACSFTRNRMYVTLWMAVSIVIWAVGIGIAAYLGLDIVSYFL